MCPTMARGFQEFAIFTLWLSVLLLAAKADDAVSSSPTPGTLPTPSNISLETKEPVSESCESSPTKQGSIATIRHATAVIAGFADGAMAQLPLASTAVVPCIQAAMIFAIAQQYGCYMDLGTALAISTLLSSDYVKMSLVSHAVGWIPLAGNVVKTTLSVVMTEGIGIAAEKMLSCPTSRQDLLEKAAKEDQNENLNDANKASVIREHFHAITDFLGNISSWSSTTDAAREVWNRVESLFRQEDQVALLGKVHEARTPQELLMLVRQYTWNLKVVEASLAALRDRFPSHLACTDVDEVAKRLWASRADGEVKAVVAPHLLHCWSFLRSDLRDDAAIMAQELAVEATRLGGGLAAVLPGALSVLLTALRGGASPVGVPSVGLLDGLMKAMRKEADACQVLRELFRHDAKVPAEIASSWAQVRHLQQLDNLEAFSGSEMCLPSLVADVKGLLTLPSLPSGAEHPNTQKHQGHKAVDQAFAGLVGQDCAVKRLMQSPGYVRLRKKGIQRPGVPLVVLMTGPSGTGKTMAARKMAEFIHGRPIEELQAAGRFKLFPMNQFRMEEDLKTFFGPPRGIQGSGDLPDLVRPNPDAVIVLDEIEKAHRSFAKALLTVFGEYGTVYDPRTGRDYPASNVTFVLTSNLAKELIIKHPVAVAKTLGRSLETNKLLPMGADVDPECLAYVELREAVDEEIGHAKENAFFRESEIRGRLTDVVPFLPFGPHEVADAVRGFLSSEAEAFVQSPSFANLELTWSEDVVAHFASLYARKPDEGLRAVNKQLQSQVRDLLERAMDVGLVPRSARVFLRVAPGRSASLDLRVVPKEHVPVLTSEMKQPETVPEATTQEAPETFFSSLVEAFSSLSSSKSEIQSSSSSGEWDWQYDWEWQSDWDWLHTWDWQVLWEQLLLFLYKWSFPLAITGLCLLAAMSAGTMAPVVAPMAAPLAAPLAPAAVPVAGTVGVTAMAVVSWTMALVQVVGGSASVAVPALTFFYAWQNRHYIEAVVFCAVSLALCPWAVRVYRTTYALLHPKNAGRSSSRSSNRNFKLRQKVPWLPQEEPEKPEEMEESDAQMERLPELPGPEPEKHEDEEGLVACPLESLELPDETRTPSDAGDGTREASSSPSDDGQDEIMAIPQ